MPKAGKASGSKAPAASNKAIQEEDNVVFAHAGKGKKKDSSQNNPKNQEQTDASPADAATATKKPDTRTLIGGASWTGKLPVNLLSEHCQKQKWGKPEYSMHKDGDGYSSMVSLKGTNPKTKEPLTLPSFKLPPDQKHLASRPTAIEARHFAATYALFRISSMRNIHMMLPPTFKDLWKHDFESMKKADVKDGKAWMYDADPFNTKVERDDQQAKLAKQRDDRERERAKATSQSTFALEIRPGQNRGELVKGWNSAPKVDIGKRTRAQVEEIIRRMAVWNPKNVQMSISDKTKATADLVGLGFRQAHIEEALIYCRDLEESLEWLLIHVPEDDLPKWSLPEGYKAGVSLASGNLKRDAAVQRLSEAGYSRDLCDSEMTKANGDEKIAAQNLQASFFGQVRPDVSHRKESSNLESSPALAAWAEEVQTLEAIFADTSQRISSMDAFEVRLQAMHEGSPIRLRIMPSADYPGTPPVMSVIAPAIPAYIKMSILRQVLEYAVAQCLGEPMVFQLIDWLETEIPHIIDRPGDLKQISLVASNPHSLPDRAAEPRTKGKTPVHQRHAQAFATSADLLKQFKSRNILPKQETMNTQRRKLPAWQLREKIVESVRNHQVTIISGETGSGKSTQSVQFILDDSIQRGVGAECNLICTQPRRISAIGLADRVSDERCSRVGDEVGYSIRGETKIRPGRTQITFMTVGVLLRRLQTSGGSRDDVAAALEKTSHIFIDEVHERSLDTDFLLALLKNVLTLRKELKIILMSATLDSQFFEAFFSPVSSVSSVQIPGRTFAVEDYYLDDVLRMTGFGIAPGDEGYESDGPADSDRNIGTAIQRVGLKINYKLIADTVRMLTTQLGQQNGGILIFLPGTMEINWTIDAIRSISGIYALPLHASLTPSEQRRVFPPAPTGQRKVVAATNVAETSITIEDIVAVIDCGRVKETTFDPANNMVKLEEVWASRAACKQRRGRAGRVRAGVCYKLYTRNAELKMAERPEPEMKRVPLEQLCLSVKAMGIKDTGNFLAEAPTPPDAMAVEGAMRLLHRIGALDCDELTSMGEHLSIIPADLRCGKLVIYGATFGCLDACLTIAAILSTRTPFVAPQQKRDESKNARVSFAPGQGDLICALRAYDEWKEQTHLHSYREVRLWCEQNFLSQQSLRDITSNRQQLLSSLSDVGFVSLEYSSGQTKESNLYNSNSNLLRALIAGAFSPQVARIQFPDKKFAASHTGAIELDPEARTIKYHNEENGRVFVHPSSTIFDAQTFPGNAAYVSYFTKMATSKVFIRDLTPFNAFSALMFGGPLNLDTLGRGIEIDGWLKLRGWPRIGALVGQLRGILDVLLAKKISDPTFNIAESEIAKVVRHLVDFDGLDR